MERLIKLPEVMATTGMSRTSIYDKMKQNLFPRCVPIIGNRVGWSESQVQAWIRERLSAGQPLHAS